MTSPEQHALAFDQKTALKQRQRRLLRHGSHFLEQEAAQRLLERLDLIRLSPLNILEVGCGLGRATALLAQRYANAQLTAVDTPEIIRQIKKPPSNKPFGAFLLEKLRQSGISNIFSSKSRGENIRYQASDFALTGVADGSQDLIVSHLGLTLCNAPHRVFPHWQRVLRPGGVVFFSCLGPGSFVQLRRAVEQAGWPTRMMPLTDMHDFGDMLVNSGFATPVMDQEVLTFTYDTADQLLQDLRQLGGNAAIGRYQGLMTAAQRRKILSAFTPTARADDQSNAPNSNGRLAYAVDIEVAYGHAWKPMPKNTASARQNGVSVISTDLLAKGAKPYNQASSQVNLNAY